MVDANTDQSLREKNARPKMRDEQGSLTLGLNAKPLHNSWVKHEKQRFSTHLHRIQVGSCGSIGGREYLTLRVHLRRPSCGISYQSK